MNHGLLNADSRTELGIGCERRRRFQGAGIGGLQLEGKMAGRPKELTDDQRRAKDAERRRKLEKSRKEAGLHAIKLYLDDYTLDVLTTLCKEHGYSAPEASRRDTNSSTVRERDSEILSNVVGYCIRREKKLGGLDLPKAPKRSSICKAQRLYRILHTARFRAHTFTESRAKIARYMRKSEYPTPDEVLGGDAHAKCQWIKADVDLLFDEARLLEILASSA